MRADRPTRQRVLLIGATSRAAAERYAGASGLDPLRVVDKGELLTELPALRQEVKDRVDSVVLHSVDWANQIAPHIYELAALALPAGERWLVDERTATRTAM